MGVVIPFPSRTFAPLSIDFPPLAVDTLRRLLRAKLLDAAEAVIADNVLRGIDSDPEWRVSSRVRDRIDEIVARAWAEGQLA